MTQSQQILHGTGGVNACRLFVFRVYFAFGRVTQDVYQACRAWTISVFQHVMANDFFILMLGASIRDTIDDIPDRRRLSNRRDLDSWEPMRIKEPEGEGTTNQDQKQRVTAPAVLGDTGSTEDAFSLGKTRDNISNGEDHKTTRTTRGSSATSSRSPSKTRRLEYTEDVYVDESNPGIDVFTLTAGAAALGSALPSTVRIVSEDYTSADDDHIELTVAMGDIAGLFERNDVRDILRGAVLSPALEIDTHYAAAVSNLSPLLKLPVDAVQRGRDHGLPTYNEARKVRCSLGAGMALLGSFVSVLSGWSLGGKLMIQKRNS